MIKKANKEKWQQLKKTQCNKIETKVQQETADKIAESEVDRISNIIALGDKLSAKIDKAIGQLETVIIDGEMVDTGIVYIRGLRSLVQSVKDLKDILSISSDTNGSVNKQSELISAIKKAVEADED